MAVRGAAPPVDAGSLFAEYPFLPGADALLGGEAVSVRSLLEEAAYERPRAIGRARVLAAADDPRALHDIDELNAAAADVRYLSFLFSRLVLAAAPSPAALRRWAVAEAKRSYARLVEAPAAELEEIARRLGFPGDAGAGSVSFDVADYVRLASPIREADFRLARQPVRAGRVTVEAKRAARLLQEAVRRSLATPLPLTEAVVALVRQRESELFDDLARRMPAPVGRSGIGPGALLRDRFPPCIRKMQRTLEKGENLSHAGRFCLAAFLHRVGADTETIVDAYRGAPDFDESVTRYQVDHITSRNDGAGYEPASCDTLRSHGLCARDGDPTAPAPADRGRDELCFRPTLRHPLQYYRMRGGATMERPGEGADPVTSGAAPGTSDAPGRKPSTGRR
jgi:DNA primase large subunit